MPRHFDLVFTDKEYCKAATLVWRTATEGGVMFDAPDRTNVASLDDARKLRRTDSVEGLR